MSCEVRARATDIAPCSDASAACIRCCRITFGLDGYREYLCGSYVFSVLTTFQPGQPSAASWYMVALVRNETSITLYSYPGALADDAVVGRGTSPNNVLLTDTQLLLGRDASVIEEAYSFFTGVFSFVGLFNTALDAEEIFAMWNGMNAYKTDVPFPPPPPSPEQPLGSPPIPDPPDGGFVSTEWWWCVHSLIIHGPLARAYQLALFTLPLWQEWRRAVVPAHLSGAVV